MDFLQDMLTKYSQKDPSLATDDFIRQYLKAEGSFEDEKIEEILQTISDTLETNSANRREIKAYKGKGLSAALWLRDALDKITARLSPKEQNEVVQAAHTALFQSNGEFMPDATPRKPPEIPEFSDINKTVVANRLYEEIRLNTALKVMTFEEVLTEGEEKHE